MTPELWERLKPLFHAALELPEHDRPAFIEKACGEDRELREELERLVHANNSAGWVDGPAIDLHHLLPAAQPAFAAGQLVLGRFRILRVVANGSAGEVYEALDLEATKLEGIDREPRRVALQILCIDDAATPETVSRFERKLQIARTLDNPHLCRIYNLYPLEDLDHNANLRPRRALLVMEFLEGMTLNETLRPVSWPEAKWLALEICNGLQAMHEAGMIHGELNSSNIMLAARDGITHAVVMDSGFGCELTSPLSKKPQPIAPEQFEGSAITSATDVYALGIVLYELVTGKHPFAASTPVAAAVARGRRMVKASAIRPEVPRRCDEVIGKCLEFDPKCRYPSARDLAAALQCHRFSIRRLREKAARIPRGEIVTVAVLFCAVIAAVVTYAAYRSHRYHPPSAEAGQSYEQGLAALRDGTYLQATRAFQNAIKLDGDFLLAHARLAEAWAELDFTGPAQTEMLSASVPEQERNLPALDRRYIDAIRLTLTEDFSGAVESYRHILAMLPHGQKAYGYLDLARAYEKAGNLREAQRNYEKAAALAPEEPAAFVHLGILKSRQQDPAGGEAAFKRADSLYAAAQNLEGRAEIAYQRGYAANIRGHPTQARAFLKSSLEIARQIPSVQLEVRTLIRLSDVEDDDGNEDAALDYANRAIRLAQENGLEYWSTDGLIHLGTAYFGNEDFADAERSFERALRLATQNGHPRLKADAQLGLAGLRHQQGNVDAAILLAQQALTYYRAFAFMAEATAASELIVRGEQGKGDYAQALPSASELLTLARKSGNQASIESAEELIGGIYLSLERYPDALLHSQAALEVSRAAMGEENIAYQQLHCADALWRLGRYSDAEKSLAAIPVTVSQRREVASQASSIRAEMRLSQLRHAEALSIARTALVQFPDMPPARVARLLRVQALAESELVSGRNTRQRQAQLEQAQQDAAKLLALANRQSDNEMLMNANLVQAIVSLRSSSPAPARSLAGTASEYFSAKGEKESEWLSRSCLSQAAAAMGDTASARQQAVQSLGILAQIESAWGSSVYKQYVSRPDHRLAVQWLEKTSGASK